MKPYIKITPDGPYLAFGIHDISEKIIIEDAHGVSIEYGQGKKFEIKSDPVALCRCGQSRNKPFCDGSHARVEFDGTETASFVPIHEQPDAEAIRGPELTLLDNQKYCAYARFCDAKGRVWNLVQMGGPAANKQAIHEANMCPAGRLLILDEEGNVLEDKLPPSIGVLEDRKLGVSGPLWICGAIRVESADGRNYEIRMKQTLCRCGRSDNKPFCNGAHAA